jgi:hypothetical protein
MNEPKKWLDEPGDVPEELSALLMKAHKAPPAMGPVAKAAAAGAVAKIGASGLVLSGAAKSVIAVALAGTIGTTTYVATQETREPTRRTTPSMPSMPSTAVSATNAAGAVLPRAPSPPEAPIALAPVAPAPEVPEIEAVQADQATPARVIRPRSNSLPQTVGRVVPSVEPSTAPVEVAQAPSAQVVPIVEEARVLESARRLLETDPARAVSLIDEHARRFPSGALGEERELLAVDALLRAGRVDAAESRARAALRAHPNGVHAARISRLIENRQAP